MGPELHFQLINDRLSDLRGQAAAHRRVREAEKGRKGREGRPERRYRAVFAKFLAS